MNTIKGIRSGVLKGPIQGSTFHLIVEGNKVSGYYQTKLGRPDFEDKYEVTGFTDGEFIGFVVMWKGYHSITSWTGRYGCDEKGEYIKSMWHIGSKYRDKSNTEETEEWNCFTTNQSLLYFVEDVK